MSMQECKVALIQHANRGGRDENLAHIGQALESCGSRGINLVLLQELHNGPYFCQRENPDVFDLAEPLDGPTVEYLSRYAARCNLVIVGSIFERRAPGIYHNTAVVLDSDGSLVGSYRKMHIPEDPGYHEKFYFTPGDESLRPIATSVGQLGVLVCWDQWYPEAARLMALAGAEMLLYPTAIGWDPSDTVEEQTRQHGAWETIQRGHAVANGLPVLACNRTGFEKDPGVDDDEAGQTFWGQSFVAGPQGEILARAPADQEMILEATVSLARSEKVRRIWPFLRDRRIDAYGDLTKRYRL